MSSKENNITTNRPRRFTITGEYDNADQITHGDVCIVRPGASYATGDLVLFECSRNCATLQTTPHYHAQRFYLINGKKYKFRLTRWNENGGHLYREGEEKNIVGPVLKIVRKGKREEAEKQAKQESRTNHSAGFDWPYFGVHKGDTLIVEGTQDVKPGQLILHRQEDGEEVFTRVCRIKDGRIYHSGDKSYETLDDPLDAVIGHVVLIQHDNCTHTKIEALRAKLAVLLNDDEHTLNLTKAFEVEKEIYNLEHPIEEEEDTNSDEWPEVIEDEN
jgi:hypothetical protein